MFGSIGFTKSRFGGTDPAPVSPTVASLFDPEDVPHNELVALDSLATPIEIPAGRVVMRQGTPGSEAIIIASGEVLVERDGQAVTVLGAGDIVGESALIANQPRSATVTAATDVTAVAMSRREFATMLDRCPRLALRVLTVAVERTERNTTAG